MGMHAPDAALGPADSRRLASARTRLRQKHGVKFCAVESDTDHMTVSRMDLRAGRFALVVGKDDPPGDHSG